MPLDIGTMWRMSDSIVLPMPLFRSITERASIAMRSALAADGARASTTGRAAYHAPW
jgi:hypothetical protein